MGTEAVYAGHFGLSERPFTLLPDPNFLYWSDQHKRAFAVLEFGMLSRAPVTVVTGEIGAGKTTLIQELLSRLGPEDHVGLISNALSGRGDLIRWVLNAFNIAVAPGTDDYLTLFQTFVDFLVEEYASGNQVVLVIDEAQNLAPSELEEIRMLTNVNSNKDELIQIFLVGQPELRDIIQRPDMRQLAQRVTVAAHLGAMDEETTKRYISHRLQHVGGTGEEFSDAAQALVFEKAEGIPRVVNQLCDLAMLYAWSEEATAVSEDMVEAVIRDQFFLTSATKSTTKIDA